jgi:hypothetical protein
MKSLLEFRVIESPIAFIRTIEWRFVALTHSASLYHIKSDPICIVFAFAALSEVFQ